ncbi:hypothetical protein THAOC_34831 [Thalassiosira oceanica]|uniref:SAP domain-containing protein n=1 Tax=Thalassiosira oceanica TaxID=159749 RepID=K0R1W0_THAOC|nr:hypothetical protein THAOC_34831 [Thalassiosira oceanica]|eukprot:EJK46498.1 hypothetical protein THAOC_34831 [Thalassiosira oceanica]
MLHTVNRPASWQLTVRLWQQSTVIANHSVTFLSTAKDAGRSQFKGKGTFWGGVHRVQQSDDRQRQYADRKNLSLTLLKKECAMNFLADSKVEVISKVSLDDVPNKLMKGLLVATSGDLDRKASTSDDKDEYTFMRVGELRSRLLEKGLCLDGSCETMIALLKKNEEHDADD